MERRSFGLKFVAPEKIVGVVVYADVSRIDATCSPDEGKHSSLLVFVSANIHAMTFLW